LTARDEAHTRLSKIKDENAVLINNILELARKEMAAPVDEGNGKGKRKHGER